MTRRMMGVRVMVLVAIVLGCLMAGCSSPQVDVSKEPNKNLKAGPPSASPGDLEQIRIHTQNQQKR